MQLAITILANQTTVFIADVLGVVTEHKCAILEFSLSDFFNAATATYLLIEGNWNCLAKLEIELKHLEKRLDVSISSLRLEAQRGTIERIPYNLEMVAISQDGILQDFLTFLSTRRIVTKEIKANCCPAAYTQTPLFSAKFVLLIPIDIPLLSFREELLNFCDDSNVDAVFEPIKR